MQATAVNESVTYWMPSDLVYEETIYPRIEPNTERVLQYARAMKAGATFPPIDIAPDGRILDGLTRWLAYKTVQADSGEEPIAVMVRNITAPRDQIRFAVEANCRHGANLTLVDLQHISRRYPELLDHCGGWINLARFGFDFTPQERVQRETKLAAIENASLDSSVSASGVAVISELSPKTSSPSKEGNGSASSYRTQPERVSEEPEDSCSEEFEFVEEFNDSEDGGEPTMQEPVDTEVRYELSPIFAKLATQGILSQPCERALRMFTPEEQKLLATTSASGIEFSAITALRGSKPKPPKFPTEDSNPCGSAENRYLT